MGRKLDIKSADGDQSTIGAKGDSVATDSTSSWSVVALLKWIGQSLKDLYTNAATASKQDTGNSSLSSIDSKLGGTLTVGLPTGAATETTLSTISGKLPSALVNNSLATTIRDASGNPVDFTGVAPVINTSSYPQGATPVVAFVSGANANITASLPGAAGKTTYLVGYMIDSLGATAGSIKNPTIAGLINGTTISTILTVVTGATTANARSSQSFNPHLPAYAANTSIDITCPALGTGNTSAMVFAWGYQL